MKSYTDLEQSKKLAEFLPPESADMCHKCIGDESYDIIVKPYSEYYEKYKLLVISKDFNAVPCWSLAALLGVLPDEVEDNHYLTLDKEGKEYCCCYEDCNGNSFRHCFSDNPIDACVAMIEKLNELKML